MHAVADLPTVKLLTPFDPAQGCALGAMRIDGIGAAALVDYLIKNHLIHVRARFVPGEWEGIRVTPNVFTTIEEVDRFSSAIRQAATKGI